MTIWDGYGNWHDIARLESVDGIKSKITGAKNAWRANYCSPALAYVFDYVSEESNFRYASGSTALDFGCGLGRNGPLLKRYFSRVVGFDVPEMLHRLKSEFPELAADTYQNYYDSLVELMENERISLLYDSVVFQHIVDKHYLSNLIDTLASAESFRTLVSVCNATVQAVHLGVLAEKGWKVWHSEAETLSFEGAPHVVTVFRRW